MRKLTVMLAALMLAGCAHAPQVNRTAKADKLVVKKAELPTPNQIVKKRWFPKFRVQWLHK